MDLASDVPRTLPPFPQQGFCYAPGTLLHVRDGENSFWERRVLRLQDVGDGSIDVRAEWWSRRGNVATRTIRGVGHMDCCDAQGVSSSEALRLLYADMGRGDFLLTGDPSDALKFLPNAIDIQIAGETRRITFGMNPPIQPIDLPEWGEAAPLQFASNPHTRLFASNGRQYAAFFGAHGIAEMLLESAWREESAVRYAPDQIREVLLRMATKDPRMLAEVVGERSFLTEYLTPKDLVPAFRADVLTRLREKRILGHMGADPSQETHEGLQR